MTFRPDPRLTRPLDASTYLIGASALALLCDYPRVALALDILAIIVVLKILSALIHGDR